MSLLQKMESGRYHKHHNNNNNNNNHHMSFHFHMPHLHFHHQQQHQNIPKGCLAILVGHEGEEELQRFVIPVNYIKHPLFVELLKQAEKEYGFYHKGPIIIPCNADEFRHVQQLIEEEDRQHHHHHDHRHHQHNHNNVWCFRV